MRKLEPECYHEAGLVTSLELVSTHSAHDLEDFPNRSRFLMQILGTIHITSKF